MLKRISLFVSLFAFAFPFAIPGGSNAQSLQDSFKNQESQKTRCDQKFTMENYDDQWYCVNGNTLVYHNSTSGGTLQWTLGVQYQGPPSGFINQYAVEGNELVKYYCSTPCRSVAKEVFAFR